MLEYPRVHYSYVNLFERLPNRVTFADMTETFVDKRSTYATIKSLVAKFERRRSDIKNEPGYGRQFL